MTPDSGDRPETAGIHHVTAIASDPTENVRFYTEALGLRFVKRTVNFDQPSTYHLYYGDETGTPGTIMTFFSSADGRDGRVGRGQVGATAFTIPEGSVDYWTDRLDDRGIDFDAPERRFDETVIRLRDGDGQPLELVAGDSDVEPWDDGPVPAEHSIRGFHGVTVDSMDAEVTANVLDALGYERAESDGERTRYRAGERAGVIDLLDRTDGPRGTQGVGTVHHVAVRAADDDAQAAMADRLTEMGLSVTEQKDRRYFRSVYSRDPGGILFEIATDDPGFTRDESVADLGSSLKLPPWLEGDREEIETQLPELDAQRVVN